MTTIVIRVIDLYPWDAGTNSGVSYQDPGAETQPRESIHRITSCNPEDDRSPFYDITCAPITHTRGLVLSTNSSILNTRWAHFSLCKCV